MSFKSTPQAKETPEVTAPPQSLPQSAAQLSNSFPDTLEDSISGPPSDSSIGSIAGSATDPTMDPTTDSTTDIFASTLADLSANPFTNFTADTNAGPAADLNAGATVGPFAYSQTPNAASPMPPPLAPSSKMTAAKRKKRRKTIKLIVVLTIVILVVGGITFGMYWLFTREKAIEYVAETVNRGMLETAVQGWGYIKPVESADIAVLSKGKVKESYFAMGDLVSEGDLLFTLDSNELDKEIEVLEQKISDVQIKIDDVNKELDILLGDEAERVSNLTVTAPFRGQLIEAAVLKQGDQVTVGEKVGLLVDDYNLTLSLYFSYAYENDITIGQSTSISIPAAMAVVTGQVSEIHKIRRISPEGTTLFEVIVSLDNPGTLTAGMEAGAIIQSGTESFYPSEAGKLAYNRSEEIIIKAPGKLTYANVINYLDYSAGETLCRIEYKEDNDQVDVLRQQIKSFEKNIAEIEDEIKLAMEGYDNLNVTAPMAGTVMYNNLIPGTVVEPGLAVISIAKMDKMMVEAQVDERQVSQVRPGMPVEINIWMMDGQTTLPGVVKSVNMTPADNSMGMGGAVNYYPAVFEMENFSGMLMSGQGVDYRLVVEQKFDILIAPVIAVKNTEQGTCVFVKSETRPENAIDLDEGIVPPGFFAVPVECGIGNENGIEIISGVEEGVEVFTQIIELDTADQNGMRGGMVFYG